MTPLEDCVRCGGTLGSVLTGACIQFPAAMSMLLAAGLLRLRRDEKQGLVFTSDRFRLRAFQRVAYAAAAAEVAAAGAELWRAAAGGAACDRAASTAAALGASLRAAAWLGVAHATNFERNWACAVAFATLELVVAGALLLAPPVESFKALQLGCGAARFAACVASVAAAAWLYFGRDDADRDAGRDDALRESLIGEPGVQPRDRAYSIDGANPLLLLESGGRRLGPSGLIERCARGRSDATPADGLPGDDAADAPPGAPPAGRAYAGATFPSKNLVGPAQPKTAVVACRAENGASSTFLGGLAAWIARPSMHPLLMRDPSLEIGRLYGVIGNRQARSSTTCSYRAPTAAACSSGGGARSSSAARRSCASSRRRRLRASTRCPGGRGPRRQRRWRRTRGSSRPTCRASCAAAPRAPSTIRCSSDSRRRSSTTTRPKATTTTTTVTTTTRGLRSRAALRRRRAAGRPRRRGRRPASSRPASSRRGPSRRRPLRRARASRRRCWSRAASRPPSPPSPLRQRRTSATRCARRLGTWRLAASSTASTSARSRPTAAARRGRGAA
ncbi:hypothetical protein M885DRAFT_124280 [Pelagophyceae sp. CCMP2097]|nr:hypothetical protein M885DRAFT_124280 [Pelagophyceae sp. CCMP2097]